VTDRTLLSMVRRGELRAEKPDGNSYRLWRAHVEAFIEAVEGQKGDIKAAPGRSGGAPAG
jgi:excisionase family DNA binding protein